MKYSKVYIDSIGYEIAPVVVSSAELERRLKDLYDALHLSPGQLEALTGIVERRWWEEGYRLSDGAIAAARRALDGVERRRRADRSPDLWRSLPRALRAGHGRRVASVLGVGPESTVYDVSNACLGVLNGMVEIANRIELGQIRAGMVVSCETAREINEIVIDQMLRTKSMDFFKRSLATLTGGSGAVAVLLTDGSFSAIEGPTAAGWCHPHGSSVSWSLPLGHRAGRSALPASIRPVHLDRRGVRAHPRRRAGQPDLAGLLAQSSAGIDDQVDKVICHQVGSSHRETILRSLGIPESKDFSTFPYLGNMGTVSLPLTAALAEDRDFFEPGDRVAFLGIGSGLNCMMLGVEW